MARRRKKAEEPIRFTAEDREYGPECITQADDGREIRCPTF